MIPEGRDKNITIKECTKEGDLYTLGFRRYRFLGETDEKFPMFEGASGGIPVNMMNVKGLARFKNKPAKDPKGSDAGGQKPVGAPFKKPEGDAAAAKRKPTAKEPPQAPKKSKKGDAAKDDPPVVIVDDCPASGVHEEMPMAQVPRGVREPSLEVLTLSLPAGTAVLNGTTDPRALLRGITLDIDRASLGADDDQALEDRILRSSLTTCIALGEQFRRLEEWRLHKAGQDAKMKELILKDSKATKLMAQLEEDLQLARAEAGRLREEKAKAEEAAAESARRAAEEAEAIRAKAVATAREAISGFLDGGWLSSVVEASVDEWCEGPGEEWMARKGKQYYDGGEFFTQALIYRRMARHLKIEPKDFDPAAYGLPPCSQTSAFLSPPMSRGQTWRILSSGRKPRVTNLRPMQRSLRSHRRRRPPEMTLFDV
ncbi:unnamed protein product [Cuscuta europaea]|uniref:Uncharacterized protein n=2 Tax=Cuscuta europaea TaxID=41803 RepID=A0A9P0Z2U8_CUSEU|nr:unnamed protein product [Cuscuta europaea]